MLDTREREMRFLLFLFISFSLFSSEAEIEALLKSISEGGFKERRAAKKKIEKLSKEDKKRFLKKIENSDDPELKEIASELSANLIEDGDIYLTGYPKGTVFIYKSEFNNQSTRYRLVKFEGTEMIDGKKYYKFNSPERITYARQDNSGVYMKEAKGNEFCVLKLPVKKGDNWQSKFKDANLIYKVNKIGPYKLLDKTYKNAIFLDVNYNTEESQMKSEIVLIKGIGFVKSSSQFYKDNLVKIFKPGEKIPDKYKAGDTDYDEVDAKKIFEDLDENFIEDQR